MRSKKGSKKKISGSGGKNTVASNRRKRESDEGPITEQEIEEIKKIKYMKSTSLASMVGSGSGGDGMILGRLGKNNNSIEPGLIRVQFSNEDNKGEVVELDKPE